MSGEENWDEVFATRNGVFLRLAETEAEIKRLKDENFKLMCKIDDLLTELESINSMPSIGNP
jgi:hypothetical protein